MSAAIIPDANKSASEEQTSVQKMLIENGRIIETIAEYQRLGRPVEAVRYQELLHRNLLYLGRLVDPQLAQQIQNIRASSTVESSATDVQQQPLTSVQNSQQQINAITSGALPSPQQSAPVMNVSMGSHPQQQPHYLMNGGPGMAPPVPHQQYPGHNPTLPTGVQPLQQQPLQQQPLQQQPLQQQPLQQQPLQQQPLQQQPLQQQSLQQQSHQQFHTQ